MATQDIFSRPYRQHYCWLPHISYLLEHMEFMDRAVPFILFYQFLWLTIFTLSRSLAGECIISISTETFIDTWILLTITCTPQDYDIHTTRTNTRSLRNTLTCLTCVASKPLRTLAGESINSINTETSIETWVRLTIIYIYIQATGWNEH